MALIYSKVTDYSGPIVGDVDAGFPPISADLPWGELGSVLVGGIVIALVGFAEPASIARTFANEEHSVWSSSREFRSIWVCEPRGWVHRRVPRRRLVLEKFGEQIRECANSLERRHKPVH